MKCPTCDGTGVKRLHWNERYSSEWGYTWCRYSTINRFRDEWCKRCEGKGAIACSDSTPDDSGV